MTTKYDDNERLRSAALQTISIAGPAAALVTLGLLSAIKFYESRRQPR